MLLWRISNYADLSGEGGRRSDGRWHEQGRSVVYLAEHPALALLGVLVHLEIDPDDLPSSYQLLTVEVPDGLKIEALRPYDLDRDAPGWRRSVAICRTLSAPWFDAAPTALLRVPSVIVPASNFLLNPQHPDAPRITVSKAERLDYDGRLFAEASTRRPAS